MLRIYLFGSLRIQRDGEPIDPPPRKASRRLLAWLLLNGRDLCARDEVAFALWPDEDRSSARTKLRRSLYHLLSYLENLDDGTQWIERQPRHVSWRASDDACWIDLRAFETAIEELQRDAPASDPRRLAKLQQTAELSRSPLLEDLDDDWVQMARGSIAIDRASVLRELARQAAEVGALDTAREAGETALAIDARSEPTLRLLIQICLEAGNIEAARGYIADFAEVGDERRPIELSEDTQILIANVEAAEDLGANSLDRAAASTGLPVYLNSFIGRHAESEHLSAHIRQHDLVSVIGPGGVGKTRLAVTVASQVANDFEHGVRFVDLASQTDPRALDGVLAAAVGLAALPNRPLLGQVIDFLESRHMLILIDNCEHMLDAAATVARRLLRDCPQIRLLATSREALGIAKEKVLGLRPLSIGSSSSGDLHELERGSIQEQADALRLFLSRARAADPAIELDRRAYQDSEVICQRLEGIPLAIELAAARLSVLPLATLREQLEQSFSLLRWDWRDLPQRHRALQTTIAWSYDLLEMEAQRWFRYACWPAGGFGAEQLAFLHRESTGADNGHGGSSEDVELAIAALVDKSLVLTETDSAEAVGRYRILEPLRDFGQTLLDDSRETDRVASAQARYHLQLARRARPHLTGAEAPRWLDRLELEHSSLRQTLLWLYRRGERAQVLMLGGLLYPYWYIRGHVEYGRHLLDEALRLPGRAKGEVEATALLGCSVLALAQGDLEAAQQRIEQSIAVFRETDAVAGLTKALDAAATIANASGDLDDAVEHCRECLRLRAALEDEFGRIQTMSVLADVELNRGALDEALALYTEILERLEAWNPRQVADHLWDNVFIGLGDIYLMLGRFEEAEEILARGLSSAERRRFPELVATLKQSLAQHAGLRGKVEEAERLFRESIGSHRRGGHRERLAVAMSGYGELLLHAGRLDEARLMLSESAAINRALKNHPNLTYNLLKLVELELAAGYQDRIEPLMTEVAAVAGSVSSRYLHAWRLRVEGDVAMAREDWDLARLRLQVALRSAGDMDVRPDIIRLFERVAYLHLRLQQPLVAARLLGFAEARRANLSFPRSVLDSRRAEAIIRASIEVQGATAFDRAREQGRSATLDSALRAAGVSDK